MKVEVTHVTRFGLDVRIVAFEPIHTAMGFDVGLIQNTPDTRATHGAAATLPEGGDQVLKAPARGRAVVRGGFTGGHRHHRETFRGGKSAAPPLPGRGAS
jgi:hypothetical protein